MIFEELNLHLVLRVGEQRADLEAGVDHHHEDGADGQDGSGKRPILVFLVRQQQSKGLLVQVEFQRGLLAALYA